MPNATMTTVSVQLTPETEQRLRRQASRRGESLEAYLSHLAEKGAEGETQVPDMLAQGIAWLTNRTPEEVLAARQRILAASPPPRELPPGKTLLDVVEGKWPGTETDAEIREALDRLS